MNQLRGKLTYANVVSTIALFVALGGATAFAASHLAKNSVGRAQLRANAVTGAKVKDGSLGGADIAVATLGEVPSAKTARSAKTAETASLATDIAPPEELHVVGEAGEPTFAAGWGNVFPTGEKASFYKDREGVVHLQGRIARATGNELIAFVLPPGYAPAETQTFPLLGNAVNAQLAVFGDGSVFPAGYQNLDSIFLNGITWRAGR
jgi:hypothetical protein